MLQPIFPVLCDWLSDLENQKMSRGRGRWAGGRGIHSPGFLSHLSLTFRKLFLLPVPCFHHLGGVGWWPSQHMVGGMNSRLLAPWNSWNVKRGRWRNSRVSGCFCDHTEWTEHLASWWNARARCEYGGRYGLYLETPHSHVVIELN